jgi:hypothetical protein
MNQSALLTLTTLICSISFGLAACAPSQPPENATGSNPAAANSSASPTPTTGQPAAPAKVTNTATNTASPNSEKTPVAPGITASSASSTTGIRPPLTVEKLKNTEYYFLAKGPVKLVNGKYEDPATKRVYNMSEVVAYGDINKDGIKDAVTVLKVTIPNQGDFSYLVALVNDGGNPKNISSEFMGPQIVTKSLKINSDNSIEAVMDQFQAGDPACCPSLKITRTYKLKPNPTPSPAATTSPK